MARRQVPKKLRAPVILLAGLVVALALVGNLLAEPEPTSQPAASAAPNADPDPDAAATLATVAALPETEWVDDGSYAGARDQLFGDAWSYDFDNNGCDARNDVLARDLTAIRLNAGSNLSECTVTTGTLLDPYTGETISFTRGVDTSSEVQIDHLLPLKAVYATGGQAWSQEKREAVANDPINLLAVKGSENGSKSDSLPSDWLPGVYPDVSDRHDLGQRVVWDDLPADTSLQCWYVQQLVPVFVAYELGLTEQDRVAMTTVLETC
ncbi:HNH endonuclease [Cryobacterium melibiosiphilum]|uniref:HNH endonuclease n=1 Tax=Cryobacterium melibiosiphilum TaxID=995039 RepID=A0A3A5MMU6_9MICO|nr:HNH endonuclease family protein [Cryobacterium melibiosiphilum]RJT88223.1 HNH endonuclease [Cryobacterium melibiosiphilum]